MARHLMAAAVLLMAAGIAGAQAEDYPARTVTIIVPFAAGGPADITGRIVADIFNIAAQSSRRPLRDLLRMRSNSLKHNNLMLRSERRERLEAWAARDSQI